MMMDDFSTSTAPVGVTPSPQATKAGAELIKDGSTATFQSDVIDSSGNVPVLVDFWAPWCGPCKQLGPTLEKIVAEANGKIRLVKINIDENTQLASQMGVKSIPAVFSFSNGQPVDGFMGALPESDIRQFITKQLQSSPDGNENSEFETQVNKALETAEKALAAKETDHAINIYGQILQQVPEHTKALCGVTRAFIQANALEQAKQALALVPAPDQKTPEYLTAKKALDLVLEADELEGVEQILADIEANPDNMQARMDLAILYNAEGQHEKASQALIEIIKRDREWNEDGGRAKLLEFFESWGPSAPATIAGRKLLSRTLFS